MLESSSARDRKPILAVFLSDAISLSGNAIAAVAIPWFVLDLTGSPALTGVTAFFTVLPTVIALFLGGTIVDRLGFRTTSVIADLASGAAVAAIPVLHLTVGIEFWQLVVLVFLGALLDAPGMTARESLVPDLAELAGMRLERATGIVQGIHPLSVQPTSSGWTPGLFSSRRRSCASGRRTSGTAPKAKHRVAT
jgi:MFS family permease